MRYDVTFRGRPPAELGDKLNVLKQEGCAILVTGEVPPDVTTKATRLQLGTPDASRVRVLALAGSTDRDVTARLPGDVSPTDHDVHVIQDLTARETAAESATGIDPPSLPSQEEPTLGFIRDRVTETIRSYEKSEKSLKAGQVRFVADSLKSLLDDYRIDPVDGFIYETAKTIRRVSGMAHYHLPVPDEHEIVKTMMDTGYFDARVEYMRVETLDLQRWHLPGFDELPWLKL